MTNNSDEFKRHMRDVHIAVNASTSPPKKRGDQVKEDVVCNHNFFFRQLLVPKNDNILAFLTEVKKVSSTLA